MFFQTRTLQEQLPNSLFVAVIGWFLFKLGNVVAWGIFKFRFQTGALGVKELS